MRGSNGRTNTILSAARRAAGLASLLVASALLCGCGDPAMGGARLSRSEELDLDKRAIDLLIRAGQGDIDLVASNAIESLAQVAPREGTPVFQQALQSDSAMVRFTACAAIGQVRDRSALPLIRRLAADPDARVRLAAAFAGVRCGEIGQARVLVAALSTSPDENLRADAAYLLGRLNDRKAAGWLTYAAKLNINEKSNKVLLHIYTGLALLGDKAARDRLVQYTQGDALSRLLALQGLVDLADPESREALRYRLGSGDEYLEHRLLAARALGRMKSKEGYDLALGSTSFSEQDPQDPDRAVRVRSLAALALGDIGDARALPTLRNMASEENDARVQVAACYAICAIVKGPIEN